MDELICRAGTETQMWRILYFFTYFLCAFINDILEKLVLEYLFLRRREDFWRK